MSVAAFRPVLLIVLLYGTTQGRAQPLFEAPWIGYNIGVSAFPGSGTNSLERDPQVAEAVDLDGDGDIDLVVANQEYAAPAGKTDRTSGFVVLLNDGHCRFGEPTHYTVSVLGSFGLGVGDFDEDGDPDVVVTRSGLVPEQEGNSVALYLNDGDGGFAGAGLFTVGLQPTELAVADFNNDGHLDVAVVCSDSQPDPLPLSLLFGDGAGGFTHATVEAGLNPHHVAVGDLNGDASPDLIVGGDSVLDGHRFALLFNDGDGTFSHTDLPHVQNFVNYRHPVPALADLDRDGALDLIYGVFPVSNRFRDLAVRYGHGDGTFGTEHLLDLGEPGYAPRAVAVRDLDGDGWDDLVLNQDASGHTGGIFVARNDGSGGLVLPASRYASGQKTVDVTTADLDGDGDPEIVAVDEFSMGVMVYDNPGDGAFPVLPSTAVAGLALRLDAADLDGDGDLDAVASSEHLGGACTVLHNGGTGTFSTVQTLDGAGSCARAVLRDLDLDGFPDLLFGAADNAPPYDVFTALNDGTGRFGPFTRWPVNACGPGDVEAMDVDGDGQPDVVMAEALNCPSSGGDRLFVALGRGDGTFGAPLGSETAALPYAIEAGDFDEDGRLDIATAHYAPYGYRAYVAVVLGRGDGTFGPPAIFQTGQGPKDLVALDLDADGHLDLASANIGADGIGRETVTVLYGTGTGAFIGRQDYYAPYSPDLLGTTGIAAGDVDGDGDPDLMATTVAGGAAVYLNEGPQDFRFVQRYGIALRPFDPFYADVDGDAVPDLLAMTSVAAGPQHLTRLPGLSGRLPTEAENGPVADLPGGYVLSAVYPNPFNPQARFTLAVAEAQAVTVTVFDALGRRVAVLHDGPLAADAAHAFTLDGADLPSGVYVVRATGEAFGAARRVTLLR